MNLIVITVLLVQYFSIKSAHSQQFFFDFMPLNDEDEEINDEEIKFYEEVLEDPNYEYRLCSNNFHHEKIIQEYAWSYIVEKATETIDIEELSDYEFQNLRQSLEEFLEPTSNYISEVEVDFNRIKFFDINVCNNMSDTELENIISTYYYQTDLMHEIEDSHS